MSQGNSGEVLVDVRALRTYFSLRQGIVRSVDGVDLTIRRGKTLGVVGESGCGKSVTAQSILRIVPSPGKIISGSIVLHRDSKNSTDLVTLTSKGNDIRQIRGGEISMIFQEPLASLSPVYTIGSQISEMALLHLEVSDSEAKSAVLEMLGRVGFSEPLRTYNSYPHQLSGGMLQRAVIAMALIGRPSLLIADEPTTALDVTTEAQILRLLKELQSDFGMAIMFITHDLGVIAKMADEVAVMYLGKVVEKAVIDKIFYDARHPYLQALLKSIPRLGQLTEKRLPSIKGMVPDPFNMPKGCSFHPRCPEYIDEVCNYKSPQYMHPFKDKEHGVACHLYDNEVIGREGSIV